MTIQRAIQTCDDLKPNKYGEDAKLAWLSALEGRIVAELLAGHEGFEDVNFAGYDENTPGGTELLIQGVHEDIYVKWLMCQVDFHNAEPARYNNSVAMYNYAWVDLANWVNRTYRPRQGAGIARLM